MIWKKKESLVLDSPEELETVTEGTVIIRSHGVARDIYDLIIEKNGLHLCGCHLPLCPEDPSVPSGKRERSRTAVSLSSEMAITRK